MKKRKILALILAIATVLGALPLGIFAIAIAESNLFASAIPSGGIDGLEDHLQYSEAVENDGYIGIPVDIYTYHDGSTEESDPVVLYIINTNTERVGTDSDESIVKSMIDRGYIVVVIDYKNNEKAVSPALDWSTQKLRSSVNKGAYLNGAAYKKNYNYVVPSGHNITLDEYYWSIDKHGADGLLDKIVEVWNSDFTGVKGEKLITYPDGTVKKVNEVEAKTVFDCVNKDGNQLDLDLRMDIIYPTNPEEAVPVMTVYSSAETRIEAWTTSTRPHLTGFLFAGYAGAVFDYGYTPMARDDHYGYFDGSGTGAGSVTGDNYTYSMDVYSGIKNMTAAIRHLRWLSDFEGDKYKFNVDKFGVYGNSKGGLCTRLGIPNVEELQELRWFPGHTGETRYEGMAALGDAYIPGSAISAPANAQSYSVDENGNIFVTTEMGTEYVISAPEEQPWLTYSDGTKIPSNVQFVYSNCGAGFDEIFEGHAPTYASGSMKDGSYGGFYPGVINRCRIYDIPCLYFSMPELGHDLVHGTDKDYGIDGYAALFDMAHYYLKDEGAVCEYITINGNNIDIDTKSVITVKFSGGISEDQISKISIKNRATDKEVDGVWSSAYGDTEWYFDPASLEGGYIYDIKVTASIECKNGAYLKAEKVFSFKTVNETLDGAVVIENNTLTTTDDGIYYVFDNSTAVDESTKIGLRFSVTNDAANTVEVFALTAIDEADVKNSKVGESLGEIVLLGAGDYEIDVTEYAKGAGEKIGFLLKVKKNKETITISNKSFEDGDITPPGYSVKSDYFNTSVSSEQNHSDSGSNSLKVESANLNSQIKDGVTWFKYTNKTNTLLSLYINSLALTSKDYGRKFNVSFSVYDTDSRNVYATLNQWTSYSNYDNIDWNAKFCGGFTEAGKWQTYNLSWMIDNEIYWARGVDQRILAITAEGRLAEQNMPLYIDDIIVTEEITDVVIASASTNSSTIPSLVLHPAEKNTLRTEDSAFVQNGEFSDTVMSGDLLVGGRYDSVDSSVGKAYIKLSLKDYDGSSAFFGFTSADGNKGEIEFYGISDKELAASWSSDSIKYTTAPANDIYGTSVDLSRVFEGAPIDTLFVNGYGKHFVDITRYANDMKNKGAEYITLIIVSKTGTEAVIKSIPFDTSVSPVNVGAGGGASVGHGTTQDADHTGNGGYSYRLTPTSKSYERIRMDLIDYKKLTAEDIGRKFRVTYWVMGTKDGLTYINCLMSNRCDCLNIQKKTYTIEKAGQWQKIVYEFEITDTVINHIDYSAPGVPYPDSDQAPAARLDFEGVEVGQTIYIDDMVVEEIGLGTVTIKPANDFQTDIVVMKNNFDTVTSLSVTNFDQAYNEKPWALAASGFETATKYSISSEDHTDGEGQSVLFRPNKTYNRLKFYNTFDHELTEADIGKVYTVSFALKSNVAGTFNYGLTTQLSRNGTVAAEEDTAFSNYMLAHGTTPDAKDYMENFYNGNEAVITEDDVGKWKIYSFTVTVDETMLPKSVYYGGKWISCSIALLTVSPTGMATSGVRDISGVDLYIDDIKTTVPNTEEAPTVTEIPSVYRDFEGISSIGASVMIYGNGHEYGRYTENDSKKIIDVFELNTDPENAYSGTNSLKITSHKSYNNFKFTELWDESIRVGDKYKITFRVKSNKTGSVNVSLIGRQTEYLSDGVTYNNYRRDPYGFVSAFRVAKTDTWYTFTFEFTVDQGMIDNEIYCLRICPDMDQSVTYDSAKNAESPGFNLITSADPAVIFVDDVYSTRRVGEGELVDTITPSEQVTVSDKNTSSEIISVNGSSGKVPTEGVKKTYLSYSGGAYGNTQAATFKLVVKEAFGQTLYVYALTSSASLEGITFNSAPANSEDEGLDTSKLFGGVPIATITACEAGIYSIDVTEYVKNFADIGYTFVITSTDRSGKVTFDEEGNKNIIETPSVVIDEASSLVIETAKEPCDHNSEGDTDNICICGVERPIASLKPTGLSIGLTDEICIILRVPQEALSGFTDPILKASFNGHDYEFTGILDNGDYVFRTPRFSPHLAGEVLKYKLFAKSGENYVYGPCGETSVKDYCYKALASEEITDVEKNLIADTLNYCASAQTWVTGKSKGLVNEGLASYRKFGTKTEVNISDTGYENTVTEGYTKNIIGFGVSLYNGIRLQITDPEGLTLLVKDDGGNILQSITSFKKNDLEDCYFAYFNGSSAADLRKLYTFELVNAENVTVQKLINFSFETYANAVLTDDALPKALKDLVKAMITYGDSAMAYVSESEA